MNSLSMESVFTCRVLLGDDFSVRGRVTIRLEGKANRDKVGGVWLPQRFTSLSLTYVKPFHFVK